MDLRGKAGMEEVEKNERKNNPDKLYQDGKMSAPTYDFKL